MADPTKAEQERARAFGKSWHGSLYPDCSDERLCNFCMEIATALAHARSCALAEQRESEARLRVWINLHPALRTATVGLRDPHAVLDADLTRPAWYVALYDASVNVQPVAHARGAALADAIEAALALVKA